MTKSKLNRYIGDRIKEYRKLHQLTQQNLADRLGIHRTQISAWERKNSRSNVITVKYLQMEGIL
jgi:transcriptional regulator with XRE-family HTH domain